ncbi:MAG: putative ion channel protein [Methanomassiliicoccales archaeon PtaU1.Bin124]|nr:MAG: putative ion channel protein [Methanomassiliicoccales archaeon PtaU1.Bin124]
MGGNDGDRGLLRLSGLAALVGLVSSVLTVVFLVTVQGVTEFLNGDLKRGLLPSDLFWIFTIGLALACGLIVGLLIKRYGENSGLGHAQREFDETGKIDHRHLPDIIGTSFVSLLSGASVGPEGALSDLTGGVGTYISERLRLSKEDLKIIVFAAIAGCFGGFFSSPVVGVVVSLEYMFIKKLDYYRLIVPALVAAAVGYAGFYLLLGTSLSFTFSFPGYDAPRMIDLFYAFLLGLLGAGLGIIHMLLMRGSGKGLAMFRSRPVQRALLGAAVFGCIGVLLPLSLYSGQSSLQSLLTTFKQEGALVLLALVAAKMVTMSISFGSGYKGGPIFPLLFIGGTFGMAVSLLLPFIPEGVCILVLMSSFICAIWPIPLSVALFLGLAVQPALVPVIVIGSVMGYIVSSAVKARMAEKTAAGPAQ